MFLGKENNWGIPVPFHFPNGSRRIAHICSTPGPWVLPVLVSGCPRNLSSSQISAPTTHSLNRLAGKESSQTSRGHTCVFIQTPAPAAFTGRCPHTDLPRPPTGPSLKSLPCSCFSQPYPNMLNGFSNLFPPVSIPRTFPAKS